MPANSEFVPFLISWNITKRCNLKCAHCYLDAAEMDGIDSVSTFDAMRFVDEIASVNPGAMLIMTGGEPLLRPDVFEITAYAKSKGLTIVMGTNGTLIDDAIIKKMTGGGISAVGLSLDSLTARKHDAFRGSDGAWAKTVAAFDMLKTSGMGFQAQMTITRDNLNEITELIDFAYKKGAAAFNAFFLVCTGRGEIMTDITPADYDSALKTISNAAGLYDGKMLVRARCAPHIIRVAETIAPEGPIAMGGTSGCIAGRGYLRITPDGYVTPCPYIPPRGDAPNLKDKKLREICATDADMLALRGPALKGKCSECEFGGSCGGCRARALAATGDIMNEDGWCAHTPEKKGRAAHVDTVAEWTDAASERLNNVPSFLRGMVKTGVERYAVQKGIRVITPEVMAALRGRVGR